MSEVQIQAVTCRTCAGAVAMEAGRAVPRCLYCGSDALDVGELDERIEQPEHRIPFKISPEEADHVFRRFTRSSFWYPTEIRDARLKLERVLLAAWAWSGDLETHYTGLVQAATASGKRPIAGVENGRLEGIVVPASTALTQAELSHIAPFEHAEEEPFDPGVDAEPFEPGLLSRSAARERATAAMAAAHAGQIAKAQQASGVKASSLLRSVQGRPVLLPVYIGAWRFKDQVFRVVINGQTGRLSGKAPISLVKVALVVAAVLGALLLVALILAVASLLSR